MLVKKLVLKLILRDSEVSLNAQSPLYDFTVYLILSAHIA